MPVPNEILNFAFSIILFYALDKEVTRRSADVWFRVKFCAEL